MWLEVLAFVVVLGLLAYLDMRKPKNFPPGPIWYPLVGSAPQVLEARRRTGYLYAATVEMSRKYGPVVGVKIGRDPLVFVCGAEANRIFGTSEDLSGRPHGSFFRNRTFGKRRGILLVDSSFWQEQRRFILRHLREFGFGRNMMSSLIEQEAEHLRDYIDKSFKDGSVVFNMENLFNVHVLNTLWKMMAGKRYDVEDETMIQLQGILSKLFAIVSMVGASFSHFPILKYIAPEVSGYNLYVETHKRIYELIGKELEQHKKTHNPEEPRDLMDTYLNILKSPDRGDSFSEQQLMATCLDMFMAGSETTSNSLAISFLYLILYPDVQKKAQQEVDTIIGQDRSPSLDDRPKMPYVECVVLEALRMFSGRALTVPHRAMRDTYLMGYFIPKDTLVVGNLHESLMTPEAGFPDGDIFRPERYMRNGKIHLPDTYIPFGFGKHRCMGETLARANLFVFVCYLLQRYDFAVVPDYPPDMQFVDGVTPGPKHFKARVSPRTKFYC